VANSLQIVLITGLLVYLQIAHLADVWEHMEWWTAIFADRSCTRGRGVLNTSADVTVSDVVLKIITRSE